MTDIAIQTEGLTKRFGEFVAVDSLDLRVDEGTVVSLLGPNGAGKTTTVRMLATLIAPDGGHARVAGFDVVSDAARVRERISLSIAGFRCPSLSFGLVRGLHDHRPITRAKSVPAKFHLQHLFSLCIFTDHDRYSNRN